MDKIGVETVKYLKGEARLIGDKSISHRAVMIGSIAEGTTKIANFANNEDCLRTVNAFRDMGINIDIKGNEVIIKGKGLRGLKKPSGPLYLGNSGTTMRLLLGILAGQDFDCLLTGDDSLSSRPMSRVVIPLRKMGAAIEGKNNAEYAPLKIKGAKLKPLKYDLEIPSAQVKSCILLAGLYAGGETIVNEHVKSRDHTERMLKIFGADLSVKGLSVSVKGNPVLSARGIEIPNDISGASFFMAGAALLKGSDVYMKSVLYNPTRTGIIDVLKKMGAKIEVTNIRNSDFEPVCDMRITSGELNGVEIKDEEIPYLIDEIPVIIVAAALARGTTIIKGAKELRVKETDRIMSMSTNLARMGANIDIENDNIVIHGVKELKAAHVESFADHRTAMSMIIAGLAAKGKSVVSDIKCIDTSFPGFLDVLKGLSH